MYASSNASWNVAGGCDFVSAGFGASFGFGVEPFGSVGFGFAVSAGFTSAGLVSAGFGAFLGFGVAAGGSNFSDNFDYFTSNAAIFFSRSFFVSVFFFAAIQITNNFIVYLHFVYS